MGWQKIDDQFGVSQKVIRIPRKRRQQVVGLWVLAGNYSARALTDGRLEAHELEEIDARPADVAELVRVGLWHRHGTACASEDCVPAPAGGVTIHDYLRYNPSRAEVEANREAERVRKASWRESKRSPSGTDNGTPPGSDSESGHPVPSRPVPIDRQDLNTRPNSRSSPVEDDSSLSPTVAAVVQVTAECGLRVHPLCAPSVVEFIESRRGRNRPPVKVPTKYYPDAIRQSWPEVEKFIHEKGLAS